MKNINTIQLINFINELPTDISNIIRDNIKGIQENKNKRKQINKELKIIYNFYHSINDIYYIEDLSSLVFFRNNNNIVLEDNYDAYRGYYVDIKHHSTTYMNY
jgi:hypothetical protein